MTLKMKNRSHRHDINRIRSIQVQFMRKLCNTETELNKRVA